jgi:2-oxoglutarate ferredoxin oxidoreductase subunit beta
LHTDKETKEDNVLVLEHNQPMVFGQNKDQGIKLDGLKPVVIDISNGKYSVDDLFVHDEFDESPVRASILSSFTDMPGFPTPIGVFRQIFKPTYGQGLTDQINEIKKRKGEGDLEKVLFGGNTWEVN